MSTADSWRQYLTEDRKLQPSHRRHVFQYKDYIIKIALEPDESDYMGQFHDTRRTLLADENEIKELELVRKYTTIPLPEVIDHGEGFSVFKRIEGEDLESAWRKLSPEQLKKIILEIQGYIRQLWNIPNPFSKEFVVGTLCSSHELLKYEKSSEERSNGPFKTLEEYRKNVKLLWDREPHFSDHAKSVFDHMDWFQCNVILSKDYSCVAGIIDWEYAGFIPDPRDMHISDLPIEEWHFPEWAGIFDGLEEPTW